MGDFLGATTGDFLATFFGWTFSEDSSESSLYFSTTFLGAAFEATTGDFLTGFLTSTDSSSLFDSTFLVTLASTFLTTAVGLVFFFNNWTSSSLDESTLATTFLTGWFFPFFSTTFLVTTGSLDSLSEADERSASTFLVANLAYKFSKMSFKKIFSYLWFTHFKYDIIFYFYLYIWIAS